MEAHIRRTNGGNNFFEVIAHSAVLDVIPQAVSKNEVAVIVPEGTGCKLPFCLSPLLLLKNTDDTGSNRGGTLLPNLRLIQIVITGGVVGLLDLPVYGYRSLLHVQIIPLDGDKFRLPHTGEQGHNKE